MARFRILYHSEVVRRDIPRLDSPVRRRIQIAIEERLATRPEDFAKPLAYNRAGFWSLRVGAWRVIFALREDELWVLRIGHRREVYDALDREVPDSR
ncbi:MAG TPA: type II toxin-antitoxin system RelE/ParE family toxin [Thermoanaerobaculia bacterium]|nr:type II toxin-antitoxin system RelE/ParE family toxin [Thermoanaerobaculia bacterium]